MRLLRLILGVLGILVLILLVSNLESLSLSPLKNFLEQSSNSSELSEDKQVCPTAISSYVNRPLSEVALSPESIGPVLNKLTNTSIWRIESNIRSCYKGRYKNQYPNWFYCDDMVVSRWETSSSGTIKYRWYTAVTAQWQPQRENSEAPKYIFGGFSCESGKKVTVNKDTTAYYVHVSRDGTEIKIEY